MVPNESLNVDSGKAVEGSAAFKRVCSLNKCAFHILQQFTFLIEPANRFTQMYSDRVLDLNLCEYHQVKLCKALNIYSSSKIRRSNLNSLQDIFRTE